jgi:hypothetical protein
VSLNHENPDLKRIMPWAGTSRGPESIVKTFVDVARYWEIQDFNIEALFGSEDAAAMFGRFTYRSIVLSKIVTSPFAVFARINQGAAPTCSSWKTPLRPRPPLEAVEAGSSRATPTAAR